MSAFVILKAQLMHLRCIVYVSLEFEYRLWQMQMTKTMSKSAQLMHSTAVRSKSPTA